MNEKCRCKGGPWHGFHLDPSCPQSMQAQIERSLRTLSETKPRAQSKAA